MKRNLVAAVLFAALATIAAAQYWENIQPFSADVQSSGRTDEMNGKIHWSGGSLRMDMKKDGKDVSMINNVPKKTSYIIMHDQRMYMEMAGDRNPMAHRMNTPQIKPFDPNNPCANQEGYTCKKVGTETVNGRSCDKWEITGPDGRNTVWIDQKIHFPVRSVSSDGATFNLTNIKEGPQPATDFEVPAGYRKFDFGAMGRQ